MEIQVPIKRDAIEFVEDIQRQIDSYLEQAVQLEAPMWGISDDEETAINKTKASLYRSFANYLAGLVHCMETPNYQKFGS